VSFYQSKRRSSGFEPNTTMNFTALVDVLLVTLIIFMLVSPTLEHGIDVQLPVAKPYKMTAAKPVLVSLSRQGALFFNNQQVDDAQLRARLQQAARANPETPVVLRGDAGIPYGELIRVLDLVRGSGLTNIGLATRSPGG
jgi:biopolymer transport protein ExbD